MASLIFTLPEMNSPQFDVSFVVTVFNKERYILDTARSLFEQEGGLHCEYIFVDDVSSDNTLSVLEAYVRDKPHVAIVRNTVNQGPSIRLNQGVSMARGKYVLLFDSDDILAKNAAVVMHGLLEREAADVIYGQWEKTQISGAELLSRRVAVPAPHRVSDNPLEFVLRGRFLRMSLMARREVYLKAGGADERIFIQDESLPLRLAAAARRFIALDAPIMFVPRIEGALSGNKSQLNHDRFLASHNLLIDQPQLQETARRLLFQRCVSAAWKQQRDARGPAAMFSTVFAQYLRSKCGLPPVDTAKLEALSQQFAQVNRVRRIA